MNCSDNKIARSSNTVFNACGQYENYCNRFFDVCFLISSKAQNLASADSLNYSTLKEQADVAAQFTVNKNYKSLADYTYPLIIRIMGGKDKMIAYLNEQAKEMEGQGYSIVFLKLP